MTAITLPYGFGITLDRTHEAALAETRDALVAEGFSVLTEVDLSATLRARVGADIGPYVLLGVCSAPLALRALQAEPAAGLLLPCTVAVYGGTRGRSVVAALDPAPVVGMTGNAALAPVGADAAAKLHRVLERLAASAPPAAATEPPPAAESVEEIC